MSLARAFTRRLGRVGERAQTDSRLPEPVLPARTLILKASVPDYYYEDVKPRPQISLPMELTETTNMLAFDAPDISSLQFLHNVHTPQKDPQDSGLSTPWSEPSSSGRSSDEHSGRETSTVTPANEEAPTLTDASSTESSPVAPKRTDYFPVTMAKARDSSASASASDNHAPVVPRRCPSHSKREHERVARSRSISRTRNYDTADERSSPATPRDGTSPAPEAEWRTSFDILGRSGSVLNRSRREHSSERNSGRDTPSRSLSAPHAERRPNHPFSRELEQLNEVAEDVTGLDDALETLQDEDVMHKRGLVKHSVDVYAADIQELKGICFGDGNARIAHVDATGAQGWI